MIPQIEGSYAAYGTPQSHGKCKLKTQAVDEILARLAERERKTFQQPKKIKRRIKR